MAVTGFLLSGYFGEGLSQIWKIEKRVIAETQISARAGQELAADLSIKSLERVTIPSYCDYTHEFSSSFWRWQRFKTLDEHAIILLIRRVSVGCWAATYYSSVTRGVYARGPIQGLDRKPRIIGCHQLSWHRAAVIFSFNPSIGFERRPVFNRLGQSFQSRQRLNRNSEAAGCSVKVPDFTGI